MLDETKQYQLPREFILARWLVERYELWQMDLLDQSEIDAFCRRRGLGSLFVWKSIQTMWQLGLVNADLVSSPEPLNWPGLIRIGIDNLGRFLYADERMPIHHPEGWAGVELSLQAPPEGLKLLFHPFRYYVFARISRMLQLNVSDMQLIFGPNAYDKLVAEHVRRFQEFSGRPEFPVQVHEWNRVVALAVAAEPIFHSQIFGYLRLQVGLETATWYARADEHWVDLQKCCEVAGFERLNEWHRQLCMLSDQLDPNIDVHVALRLADGDWRWRSITGDLGGAMCLLAVAETLRRAIERAFETSLPEVSILS